MKNQKPNNSDTKWMGAGLLAAFVASLCCITPVAAFLAGIGGVGSTFAWVEPFRPWLIGITALMLGFAWYQNSNPNGILNAPATRTLLSGNQKLF